MNRRLFIAIWRRPGKQRNTGGTQDRIWRGVLKVLDSWSAMPEVNMSDMYTWIGPHPTTIVHKTDVSQSHCVALLLNRRTMSAGKWLVNRRKGQGAIGHWHTDSLQPGALLLSQKRKNIPKMAATRLITFSLIGHMLHHDLLFNFMKDYLRVNFYKMLKGWWPGNINNILDIVYVKVNYF